MPRIHMPPGRLDHHVKNTECMTYNDSLEIEIRREGDIQIEDPDFFTERFIGGIYPKDKVLGKFYAKVKDRPTHTFFHFTVSATGTKHTAKLEVKKNC